MTLLDSRQISLSLAWPKERSPLRLGSGTMIVASCLPGPGPGVCSYRFDHLETGLTNVRTLGAGYTGGLVGSSGTRGWEELGSCYQCP